VTDLSSPLPPSTLHGPLTASDDRWDPAQHPDAPKACIKHYTAADFRVLGRAEPYPPDAGLVVGAQRGRRRRSAPGCW
jgi:hypothetical protein